jgi:hypothetical protein
MKQTTVIVYINDSLVRAAEQVKFAMQRAYARLFY